MNRCHLMIQSELIWDNIYSIIIKLTFRFFDRFIGIRIRCNTYMGELLENRKDGTNRSINSCLKYSSNDSTMS